MPTIDACHVRESLLFMRKCKLAVADRLAKSLHDVCPRHLVREYIATNSGAALLAADMLCARVVDLASRLADKAHPSKRPFIVSFYK